MLLQSLQDYWTVDLATLNRASELKILLPRTAFLATCTNTHTCSELFSATRWPVLTIFFDNFWLDVKILTSFVVIDITSALAI